MGRTPSVVGGDDCDDTNTDHHELLDWYFDNDSDGFGDALLGLQSVSLHPMDVLDGADATMTMALHTPTPLIVMDFNNCLNSSIPPEEADDDGDGYVEYTLPPIFGTEVLESWEDDCDDTSSITTTRVPRKIVPVQTKIMIKQIHPRLFMLEIKRLGQIVSETVFTPLILLGLVR